MVSGFIGARAMHVLYENPAFYLSNPIAIFKFWQGGFVYYGSFFGALIGSYFFLKFKKESFLRWSDFAAPVLAFGYSIGRIGCFLNGCCYGRSCDWPWAVSYTGHGQFFNHELPIGPRHPTQLYASLWELAVVVILLQLTQLRNRDNNHHILRKPGQIFYAWLIMHGIGRIIMETFRDDDRGAVLVGLSIATWISMALIIVAGVLTVKSANSR